MEKHTIKLTISGKEKEAKEKAKAIAVLCDKLDSKTLVALAQVAQTDPAKVALAKRFLGIA